MITLAEVDTMLRSAQPILSVTLYPAAAILAAVFGSEAHRLGADTQHDVSDYVPPPNGPLSDVNPEERRRLRRPSLTPIHDELAAELVRMSDEGAHAIARQWLREIAVEQRAGDIIWNASPATDRDLTGAFPVVRAA